MTTTTECPTTTTSSTTTTTAPVRQTRVRITGVSTDHIAGHPLTIRGTAAANRVVFVFGTDRKNGKRQLGSTTAGSNGAWQLREAHGFLYNTVVQATSGTQRSSTRSVGVHQVLKIKSVTFVGEQSNGLHYTLQGVTASHVPGEAITVTLNGKVLGKATLGANGSFTVKFVVHNRNRALNLHGTGRSGSGAVYTLPGSRKFHVH